MKSIIRTAWQGLALLGVATLAMPTPAIAQDSSTDQHYLNDLYSFLQNQDALTYQMATYLTDDVNVFLAYGVCQYLNEGATPQAVYNEFMDGFFEYIPTYDQQVYEQFGYTGGLYMGSVMNLGSAYYCPEYRTQVVQTLQSM